MDGLERIESLLSNHIKDSNASIAKVNDSLARIETHGQYTKESLEKHDKRITNVEKETIEEGEKRVKSLEKAYWKTTGIGAAILAIAEVCHISLSNK